MFFDDIKQVEYDCSKQKIIDKDKYNFHTGKGGVLYHPKFFDKTMKHFLNDNIFNKVCPDIKLANNRIDKLKTRAK